ncbi:hypothetical protein [Streptomyces tsukubensis]|uniref:hypothetical protein n=1 Tax=Streptomyces tsukubensis TaxID=83656 RepID=UPI0012A08832|nr:hypothetical protein [Streptomyces tsukubensis]AZK94005.1 hypothetical protein B7R87_09055 [Streptomyces tsukubensis]
MNGLRGRRRPRARRTVGTRGTAAVRLRALAAAVAVAAAAAGTTACEPRERTLSSSSVAMTTKHTARATLERIGFDIRSFSCTATVAGERSRTGPSAVPAGAPGTATVACEGSTRTGQAVALKGKVTDETAGACVRGDLDARVDGKLVFEAQYLGQCDKGRSRAPATRTPGERPRPAVTKTVKVTGTATVTKTATVTVTETRTVTPGN